MEKISIQRFADAGSVYIDPEALNASVQKLNVIIEDVTTIVKEIITIASNVVNSESFKATSTEAFSSALSLFQSYTGNEFSGALTSLVTFLQQAVTTYQNLDIDYSSEINSWTNTFQDAISKVTGGLNSTVAQGSYTGSQYVQDQVSHVQNISTASKTIVSEVAGMIQDAGNLHTSYTGQTVIQSAVGTINKLFSYITNNSSTGKGYTSSLMNKG